MVKDASQKISSFFKPSQSQPKRKEPDVIVLDSDSSDEDAPPTPLPPKKPKLEQPSDSLPALPSSTAATAPPVASTSATSSALVNPSRPAASSSHQVSKWRFDATQSPSSLPVPSDDDVARRDAYASKLLANPHLLKRRTGYLQAEDRLAASEGSGSSSRTPWADDDAMDVDEDAMDVDEESDDQPAKGKGKGKANAKAPSAKAKGKGKGRGRDTEDEDEEPATSRLAQFAAAPSEAKAKATAAKAKGGIKYTPLEKQVIALREENPGVILMVEVGYKFRFFQEDAQVASRILGIACFPSQHMLTASIPSHRLNVHIKRLINSGQKVGVVLQQETKALKKASDNRSGPFTRVLSALYTSATWVDELAVDPLESAGSATATLMCIVEEAPKDQEEKVRIALVAVMPSTGEAIWDEFEDGHMRSELETRMLHLQPSELILQKTLSKQTESMVSYLVGQDAGATGLTCRIERIAKTPTREAAFTYVSNFYVEAGQSEETEIVLDDDDDAAKTDTDGELHKVLDLPKHVLIALSALIKHLKAFALDTIFLHKHAFTHFSNRATMCLNGNTLDNLEILRNQTDFKEKGSLMSVLDHCKTSFGRRKLRKWLAKPLVSLPAVLERQDAVAEILNSSGAPAVVRLRQLFKGLPDLERGLVRIHVGKATPLELLRVLQALSRVAEACGPETSASVKSPLLIAIANALPRIKKDVDARLAEIDATQAREGNKSDMFKPSEELFEDLQDAKDCLGAVEYEMKDELQACRRVLKKPGLEFVKVSQEEYLIEVRTNESKKIVPDSWIRVNSTKQVIRFRSPGIQKKLTQVEQAREHLTNVANAAFKRYLQRVSESYDTFRACISQLATADCLFSLATVATSPGYCRPDISSESGTLKIVGGRHPMVEVNLSAPFVPNDVSFGPDGQKQMILTGLNMGGKSSLSRSVALIALMAQIGSYVPADSCTTSLFDGIYTRMGASDELARGRSTFMVELAETSEILKLATPRSLIILDELGRGTSTSDGQAIAQAVLQFIVEKVSALTIFITHYPQLAEISHAYPEDVKCHHMSCLEEEKSDGFTDVIFLFKLKEGLASRSHGLNVARMAELPEAVLKRALAKSRELEDLMKKKARARRIEKLRTVLTALVSDSMEPGALVELAQEVVEKGSL